MKKGRRRRKKLQVRNKRKDRLSTVVSFCLCICFTFNRFRCQKLVLVGDPKQLQPTIKGPGSAHSCGLEQSLFERCIKNGLQPIMLRVQYRCHPVISAISNNLFYDQQLVDGVTASERAPLVPFMPPLAFISIPNGRAFRGPDGSLGNKVEAAILASVVKSMLDHGVPAASLGVVTLYRCQAKLLHQQFADKFAQEYGQVQVSTVDAFQGGEKDIILLSCVLTEPTSFLGSPERTNVALSRAKHHLLIFGLSPSFY